MRLRPRRGAGYVRCARGEKETQFFWGPCSGKCGWLKDRYGLSWQIIPTKLPELLQDKDPEKAKRVMQAMLKMTKIEIAELEEAYATR